MHSGWFASFIKKYLASVDVEVLKTRVQKHSQPWKKQRKTAAKRHIYISLHQRGLAYGLPLPLDDQDGHQDLRWDDATTPFMRIWCDLAIEVDCIMRGDARGPDLLNWLLGLFALFVEQDDLARQLFKLAPFRDPLLIPAKILRKIEQGLDKKRLASANPLLGLPLRNAFVYSNARMFTRIALTLADKDGIDDVTVQKLRAFFWKERHRQAIALAAISAASTQLNPAFLNTARKQLGQIGLPREQVAELREGLEKSWSAEDVVKEIKGHREAGYLLEQLAVAAMIDADYDPNEQAFMAQIAKLLKIPTTTLRRIERRVWDFVIAHREDYDRYTETQFYGRVGARIEKYLTRLVQKNLAAVVTEVRQTGELAALLTRAASGRKLSPAEKERMREQLLDIVRTIPSLAIFALPGGALLLPVVLRLLPWDLRPTAFRK